MLNTVWMHDSFIAGQWPTVCRSTILSACSMTGRFGAATAPMTIILVAINWHIIFLIPFSFNKFPIILTSHTHPLSSEQSIIHYQHCYSVESRSLVRYWFSSVRKHFRKNYPIRWTKPNACSSTLENQLKAIH